MKLNSFKTVVINYNFTTQAQLKVAHSPENHS